jgi:hypothetical protein
MYVENKNSSYMKNLHTICPNLFYLSLLLMPFLGFGDYRPIIRPTEIIFCLFIFFNFNKLITLMKTFSAFYLMIGFNIVFLILGLFYVNEDLWQLYLPYATGKFFLILICILFFIFSYHFFSTYKLLKMWLIALIFISLAHMSMFFLGEEGSVMKRAGFFFEGNFASLYYILSIYIIYFSPFKVRIKFFTFSLIFIGLLISQSTIGILCFILIMLKFIRKKYFLMLLAPLFILLLSNNNLFLKKLGLANTDANYLYSFNDRFSLTQVGFDSFLENPLFGHGLATYPFVIDYSSLFATTREFAISNNIYIDLFINYGVLGTFIFCFTLYKSLKIDLPLFKKNLFFGIIFNFSIWDLKFEPTLFSINF